MLSTKNKMTKVSMMVKKYNSLLMNILVLTNKAIYKKIILWIDICYFINGLTRHITFIVLSRICWMRKCG